MAHIPPGGLTVRCVRRCGRLAFRCLTAAVLGLAIASGGYAVEFRGAPAPPAAATPPAEILVLVEVAAPAAPTAVRLEAGSGATTSSVVEVALAAGRGEARISLPSPQGGEWWVRGSAEGLWSPQLTLPAGRPLPVRVALRLLPAGTLAGAVSWPNTEKAPPGIELALRRVAERDGTAAEPQELAFACPLDERGTLGCVVPAGRWHVRIAATPLAPAYRWDVTVPAGATGRLGEVSLRLGATVMGRVATGDGAPITEAEVTLRPAVVERDGNDSATHGLKLMARQATTNRWGYFTFEGVAAGAYRVGAARQGLAPLAETTVGLQGGEAVELRDDLVLVLPPRLTVEVSPAGGPYGGWTTVDLLRFSVPGHLEDAGKGELVEGRWTSPPLAPGRYAAMIEDERGGNLAWREIELTQDHTIFVELDLVAVKGEVLLAGEPLPAKVWFGGIGTTEGGSVEAPEGTFTLVLPRPGAWSVDVTSDDPLVHTRGLEVEVDPPPGTREATVRIELPDTLLAGEVVDGAGEPAPKSWLRALRVAPEYSFSGAPVDGAGRFELRGAHPGTWAIHAKGTMASSRPLDVELAEGVPVTGLRLVLEETARVRGRLVGPAGPVRLARILAVPLDVDGGMIFAPGGETHSELDGAFEVELPAAAALAQLLVLAPGHVFAVHRVPVGDEVTLRLEAAASGGTLVIPVPAFVPGAPSAPLQPVVWVEGEMLSHLSLLFTWVESMGLATPVGAGDLVVPAMPAGRYLYCELGAGELTAVAARLAAPVPSACAGGELAPGGRLELGL